MIITVFVSTDSEQDHWQARVLESAWQSSGQAGELVRLVACQENSELPLHGSARVVRTLPWEDHPYISDNFAPYNKPAALLEWLLREKIDATILLLDLHSILLEAVEEEVLPGTAVGNSWPACPRGEAPFQLSNDYLNLQAYCVNRDLKIARIQFPMLIHSSDLLTLAPRWLELTGIIRCEATTQHGRDINADKVAYAVAAAEFRIPHKARKLAVHTRDKKIDRAVLNYQQPIESASGKIVWDIAAYKPGDPIKPEQAKAGVGREFLAWLAQYTSLRESGGHLRLQRPRRCPGVREAQIQNSMLLEVPGRKNPLNLNSSAASIWKLCDGRRTLADVAEILESTFEVPRGVLFSDIEIAVNQLHADGALDLEVISA